MQHDGTLDSCPFTGPFYIQEKAPTEQFIHNNHKHRSRPKDFNKKKDTSKNIGPPQAKISRPRPKVNSVQFYDPYDHIHHMEIAHEDTHIFDPQ